MWVKTISTDPSAALYVIAIALFLSAVLVFLFIPKNLTAKSRMTAQTT